MPVFLAGPAAKILALTLLVGVIFGAGFYRGTVFIQTRWDAAIAEQAVWSAETVIKGAENTAQVVTKYIRVKGETEIRTETVEKEVVRYVAAQHPDCFIPREFEWVWDDANGLPATANPAERTDAADDSGLTTAAILSAHADAARLYHELRDQHLALREWVTTSYAIQQEGAGR